MPSSFENYRFRITSASLWMIVLSALMLVALGLSTIYVVDTSYRAGHDGPRNAVKQLVIFIGALGLGVILYRIGYMRLRELAFVLFAAAILLLIPPVIARLTHSTFGGFLPKVNGAYRWIRLPAFQLQPSEVAKVAYVLAMAAYLRNRTRIRTWPGLFAPLLMTAVPMGLILLEPDLGTCLLLPPIMLAMLLLAGARKRHLVALIAGAVLIAPLAWSQIHTYQKMRIVSVLMQTDALREAIIRNPEGYSFLAEPKDAIRWHVASGYQLVASKNATGSGGLTGFGWGAGPYLENPLLPDAHNDFIFAVIGHQWGLAGCVLVLTAFTMIVLAGFSIALGTRDPFGRLLAAGLSTLLGLQMLVNVCMTLGLMPITGLTLPLVSQGGCSQLMYVLALVLILSVGSHRPFVLSRPRIAKPRDRQLLLEFQEAPQV